MQFYAIIQAVSMLSFPMLIRRLLTSPRVGRRQSLGLACMKGSAMTTGCT